MRGSGQIGIYILDTGSAMLSEEPGTPYPAYIIALGLEISFRCALFPVPEESRFLDGGVIVRLHVM